jgi:endonuclease/exonuclease/phosphatase family metal-dependent hydrolase
MKPIKVATFNISGQNRLGGPEGHRMLKKAYYKIFPDLIGFQEFGVTTHSPGMWSRMPHMVYYMGIPANDIYMNPIGWNKFRFDFRAHDTQWLSESPRIRSEGWEGAERAFSMIMFQDNENEGRPFLHLNTHLDNKSETARVEGTKQILEVLTEYRDIPIIVTGDFNCSPVPAPEGEELPYSRKPFDMFLEAGFTHAWTAAHPGEPYPATFHDRRGMSYRGDHYRMWHLDWIMVSRFTVLSCDIAYIDKPPLYPSDHRPVVATLAHV